MGREKVSVIMPEAGMRTIWYVDHSSRSVFDGDTLGARYTAGSVRERCLPEETYRLRQTLQLQEEAERQQHRMHHSH